MAGSHALTARLIEVGPLSIPVWLLAAVAGYLVGILVRRLFFPGLARASSMTNDAIFTVIFVALIVWKLSPILTRWAEIVEKPGRLIYYPGGLVALVVGLVAGIGLAVSQYLRRRRKTPHEERLRVRTIVYSALLSLGFILLPVGVAALVTVGPQGVTVAASADPVAPIVTAAAGRPTVLVFWATWCGPCTAQMPEIERVSKKHGAEVQVIAVNLTGTEASEAAVEEYLEIYRLTVPVILDKAGQLGAQFNVSVTPTTVILDSSGAEIFRRSGAVTSSWIERRVLPLRS